MTFVNAVKTGFRNALVFSGRSRRPEYWWFFLFAFAGAFVISVVEAMLFGAGSEILTRLFQLAVFLPFLAVAWRRMQDTGKPGWWVLIPSVIVVISALVAGSISRDILNRIAFGPEATAFMTGGESILILSLSLLQVIAGAVLIWWMSRPSQRGANAYGPEPRVRAKS